MNNEQVKIVMGLADGFKDYIGTSAAQNILYTNSTAAYPSGIPSTATTLQQGYAIALNFFLGNKAVLNPVLPEVPKEYLEFSQAQLTAMGATLDDIISGKHNICTLRALDKVVKFKANTTLYTNPGIAKSMATLIDADTTLNTNDKTLDNKLRNIAWMEVTAEIGQEPRTYSALLKVTTSLLDVCNMTESDFAKLTGKSAACNIPSG